MVQAAVSTWSGVANGRIPISLMRSVGNGQVMEPHAAAQMNAALADMRAHGFNIYVVEGYRSYDTQVYLRAGYDAGKPGFNVAAPPGTSNHGFGAAADLSGDMDYWTTAAQKYWQSIEAKYGYSSAQGRADGEPWHKVCTTWLDGIEYNLEEDDMPDMNTFLNTAAYSGGPSISQVLKDLADAAPHAEAALVVQCKERGIWLIGPGYKHHMTPEESGQVAVAKYRTVDFGAATRAFDVFVAAHTQPTA